MTIAEDSGALVQKVAEIFRSWRQRLAELLGQGGLAPAHASRFAATLTAASEGAVILSRGERSLEPFELVAEGLIEEVRGIARKPSI